MAMKKRHHHEERRYKEMKSAGMLSEDHSAPANMPQDVKYHAWPSYEVGVDTKIDDTITGIDRQIGEDVRMARKALHVTKY